MKKKTKEMTAKTSNVGLITGVFLAGALLMFAASSIYSNYLEKSVPAETEEETYSAFGYGRGTNNQTKGSNYEANGRGNNQKGNQNQQQLSKQNCLMDGCLLVDDADYPVAELDAQTISYLEAALADERKALATYEATMEKFGSVRPFINIARAEEQHITTLKALFDKYGVEIPEDTTQVGALPATLSEVCAVGVQAEIDNDQLYQDMIGDIEQEDIKQVFTNLAAASLNNHLPAFERCAN